jgi:GNAT superfamily N-acetyltransferase
MVRKAEVEDCGQLLRLIRELAVYEKAPDAVTQTVETMARDGFGPIPLYTAWVAELDGSVRGFALCYTRYSTWNGRRLYLEDIYVEEGYRRLGVGKKLFDAVKAYAKETGCSGVVWQVLDWNISAIDFYKREGAASDPNWINMAVEV